MLPVLPCLGIATASSDLRAQELLLNIRKDELAQQLHVVKLESVTTGLACVPAFDLRGERWFMLQLRHVSFLLL